MIVDTFKQLLNGRESATVTFQTRSLGAAGHDEDNHHHRRHSIPRSLAAARETKTMYTRPLIIRRYQFPFRLSAHNFISTAPLVHCFVVCLLPFRAESSGSVILLRCPPPLHPLVHFAPFLNKYQFSLLSDRANGIVL